MYLISEKQSHGRGVIGSKPPGQLVTHSGLNIALPTLSSELPLPSFLDVFKYRGIVFPSLYIQRYSFFFFFFLLTHKLAGLSAPGSVKAECAYFLLFFVPFSFFFMILASDCVAETHKNWHKSKKMCPRCYINCEINLNASKQGLVSYLSASKAAHPKIFPLSTIQGTRCGLKTPTS